MALRIHNLNNSLVVLTLCSLAACGGGGGGDKASVDETKTTTLAKLNNPANPRPGATDAQVISAVAITAIDTYDETNNGKSVGNIYAQDQGAPVPFGGITIFEPSFSPPDLKLFPGNVATLRGVYSEFAGPAPGFKDGATLPEISGSLSLLYEDAMPQPYKIQPMDLTEYAIARQALGMWAEMECGFDSQLTAGTSGGAPTGRWTADIYTKSGQTVTKIPKLSNGLFPIDKIDDALKAKFAKTNKFRIRGIVQFFYNFTINPTSADDISLVCENCINL